MFTVKMVSIIWQWNLQLVYCNEITSELSGSYTAFHPRAVQCSPFSNGHKQKFVCTNSLGHRVLLRPVGTS
jgi:hypothetical protein